MSLSRRIRDFAYWRALRAFKGVRMRVRGRHRSQVFQSVDPGVRYPSYKSLDDHLDVARLCSLDGPVTEGVERCLAEGEGVKFNTGPLKPQFFKSIYPGSTVIELTSNDRPFSYFELADPSLWTPTPHAERFPELMDFVTTLPFQATSRIVIFCDARGRAVTAHRDHADVDDLHEFVWFRTNLKKPFYVMDRDREERAYFRSHSAWFDTVNQFHGADAADAVTISMRVDGFFTEEFRARIPKPSLNVASTPSYWASLER